jgi:hypothetical protein
MPNLFNNQYANLASKGRYGDTMLAHINPQEAGLLKSMGGAGTINPQTGLREFYGLGGGGFGFAQREPEPLPSLGQALASESLAGVVPRLKEITVERSFGGGGFGQNVIPAYQKISPEYDQYQKRVYPYGKGTNYSSTIAGFSIPTGQTLEGKPLYAEYDQQGKFKYIALEEGDYLRPDPNQPNIVASPRINLKGEIIDYGVGDLNQQDDGGFGSFLGGLVSDFGPMILAGLGANALAGSGLFASGAGAAGATAADIASNALAQANLGGYAGTAFSAIPSGVGAGLLGGGAAGSGSPLTGFGTGQLGADIAATELAAAAVDPLAAANISGGLTTDAVAKAAAAGGAGGSVSPSMLQSIADATGISVDTLKTFGPSVIQGLIGAGGSALTANQATNAAKTQADAQIRAAQIAADAARFRPVGVTTRFGSSNFQTDAQGNVIGAGYTPSPEILGYQNRLSTLANQGLTGAEGAQAAYAPLTGAAQNLFSLGQSYLAKTPEQAAQEYISKQTALLAPSRENQLAELRNRQFQTGRSGVATAQGGNLMNTSPELAAYYNSLAQQDLVLAANADQEARNRITFGSGLFDTGANLQNRFYSGQTAALAPFTNPMDVTSGLEQLAQNPLTLGTQIGAKTSAGTAQAGMLTGQGITNAAATMAPANAYSFGGNLLAGAANSNVLAGAVNKAFGNTPSAQQQYTFNPATGQYVPVQQFVA